MTKLKQTAVWSGVLLSALGSMTASASEVTTPHTFSSGTPAKAAEVNANFAALVAGINDNAKEIASLKLALTAVGNSGLAVTVGGRAVGSLVAGGPIDPNYDLSTVDADALLVVSSKGYFFEIYTGITYPGEGVVLGEGQLLMTNIYFDQPNCFGNKYISTTRSVLESESVPPFIPRQGFVVAATDPGDLVKAYSGEEGKRLLQMCSQCNIGHRQALLPAKISRTLFIPHQRSLSRSCQTMSQ